MKAENYEFSGVVASANVTFALVESSDEVAYKRAKMASLRLFWPLKLFAWTCRLFKMNVLTVSVELSP